MAREINKMAFWATANALLRARGQPELLFGEIQAWWDRYRHELEMEVANAKGMIGD